MGVGSHSQRRSGRQRIGARGIGGQIPGLQCDVSVAGGWLAAMMAVGLNRAPARATYNLRGNCSRPTVKERTMTTKPNDKNAKVTSKPDELTDDQLNDASGGIIFVGGEP